MFFTKGKRTQAVFLAFLITFTHSSYPLLWGVIGAKTYSYSVKGFNGLEKFLGTKVSLYLGRFIGMSIFYIVLKKLFNTMMESIRKNEEEMKKEIKGIKHEVGDEQKKLTFESDYIGHPPPAIKRLMSHILHPQHYEDWGINTRKGILIAGLPGVGKTFLVKVLADEVDAEVYILDGIRARGGHFRGSGSNEIRRIFLLAKNAAKHTVLVIDEFDAISGGRLNGVEDDAALKTLQVEMDGFCQNDMITVIGLTNRPDKLSRAILRRFDTIEIALPCEEQRKELLEFYVMRHMNFEKVRENCIVDFDSVNLAGSTEGFSQDELKSVVNNVFDQAAEIEIEKENVRVVGFDVNEGKIMIKHGAFEEKIQNLHDKNLLGRKNFLRKVRLRQPIAASDSES